MDSDLHLSALKRGFRVLARSRGVQQAGKVLLVVSGRLGLEFPENISSHFQAGDRIEVFYWGDSEAGDIWEAEVLKVVGHGKQLELQVLSWREEGRKHPRISKPIPFSGTVERSGDQSLVGKEFTATTTNISVGGLLFDTQLPLSVGDSLKISIALAGGEALKLGGAVVRQVTVREKQALGSRTSGAIFHIAVHFEGLSEEEEGRIEGLLLNDRQT